MQQNNSRVSSCEVLPDKTVRYSHSALNSVRCSLQSEQRSQVASDPQSPVQSTVSQTDAQAEQLLSNGHMSPQQRLEVLEQQQEAHLQFHKQHMFCCAASVKVHKCTWLARPFCVSRCQHSSMTLSQCYSSVDAADGAQLHVH